MNNDRTAPRSLTVHSSCQQSNRHQIKQVHGSFTCVHLNPVPVHCTLSFEFFRTRTAISISALYIFFIVALPCLSHANQKKHLQQRDLRWIFLLQPEAPSLALDIHTLQHTHTNKQHWGGITSRRQQRKKKKHSPFPICSRANLPQELRGISEVFNTHITAFVCKLQRPHESSKICVYVEYVMSSAFFLSVETLKYMCSRISTGRDINSSRLPPNLATSTPFYVE